MTLLRGLAAITVAAVMAVAGATPSVAQETVSVTVPAGIYFHVTDVSRSTSGMPTSTRIAFSDSSLDIGKALRLSVHADTSTFEPPAGPPIPASLVSWTALGASGGVGWNGTLSSSSYELVFQVDPGEASAHVDLAWALAPPGSGIRAGMHQLTIRWKIESITP